MVTSADDILSELANMLRLGEPERTGPVHNRPSDQASTRADPTGVESGNALNPPENPYTELERVILDALALEPFNIDDLSIQLGLPVAQVASTLTILELHGAVQQVSPRNYGLADRRTLRDGQKPPSKRT